MLCFTALVLSLIWLFSTPWTISCQVPLSTESSLQEYCDELPFPSPEVLPNPGIEPEFLVSHALVGGFFFYHCAIWEALIFWPCPHGMWDLNSQTRDWTGTPCTGSAALTTGPRWKSPDDGITPLIRVRCGTVVRACVRMYSTIGPIFHRDYLEGWRRKWQPTPVPLPGKSDEWRSLVGYSPWGRKESDMTERLHFSYLEGKQKKRSKKRV